MQHSHGKDIRQIIDAAAEVMSFIRQQAPDVILRFSTEDSFRSREADLLRVYLAVADLGMVKPSWHCRHGWHRHADSGLRAGASTGAPDRAGRRVSRPQRQRLRHRPTPAPRSKPGRPTSIRQILGIGERNGITPLGGLIARLYTINREYVRKYSLRLLPQLDQLIADVCGLVIPSTTTSPGRVPSSTRPGFTPSGAGRSQVLRVD